MTKKRVQKSYCEMTKKELANATGVFDQEFAAESFKPLSDADQARWEKVKRKSARPRTRRTQPVTWETVRQLALALPEAEEGTSYGTPAFYVRRKLFARLHQSGDSLVIKIDVAERAMRMKADPETFHITDHYLNYPMMLVRLASAYHDDVRDLLEESWRRSAPKRLVADHDRC